MLSRSFYVMYKREFPDGYGTFPRSVVTTVALMGDIVDSDVRAGRTGLRAGE